MAPNVTTVKFGMTRLCAPSEPTSDERLAKVEEAALYGLAGAGAAALMVTTGPSVALHEVLGHGYLGNHLVYDYAPGEGPSYQVDGWDNLKAIFESKSLPEGFKNVGLWLTGYDRTQDGAAGWCSSGYGRPNELGEQLGYEGRRAWVSLAGSLPGLALDSAMMAGAWKVRETHPRIAAAMMGYAITDHIANTAYPLHAAFMSTAELHSAASTGHDFANWAVKVAGITGLSATMVARVTALVWAGVLPTIALIGYLKSQAREESLVSNEAALAHWVQQEANHDAFKELLEGYEGSVTNDKELRAVQAYLVANIDLRTSKRAILRKAQESLPQDTAEQWMRRLSTGTSLVGVAARIATVLAETAYPGLKPFARALSIATPIMQLMGLAQAIYRVKKDFEAEDGVINAKVKAYSVARASAIALTALGITGSSFFRRYNLLFIGATVASMTLPMLLDYLRAEEIRKNMKGI